MNACLIYMCIRALAGATEVIFLADLMEFIFFIVKHFFCSRAYENQLDH